MKAYHLAILVLLASCKKDDLAPPAPPVIPQVIMVAPTLELPANNATGIWTPTTYRWTAIANATRYELQATRTTSTGQVSSHLTAYNLPANEYTFAGTYASGLHGAVVTWKVRAANEAGPGPWSETFTFRLQ